MKKLLKPEIYVPVAIILIVMGLIAVGGMVSDGGNHSHAHGEHGHTH